MIEVDLVESDATARSAHNPQPWVHTRSHKFSLSRGAGPIASSDLNRERWLAKLPSGSGIARSGFSLVADRVTTLPWQPRQLNLDGDYENQSGF